MGDLLLAAKLEQKYAGATYVIWLSHLFPHGKTGGNFEILDPNVAGSESQFFPAWGNRLCVAWNLGIFLLRWLISVGCRHNATDTTWLTQNVELQKKQSTCKGNIPTAIFCDLFGMVICDPFKGCWWPPTRSLKVNLNHLEHYKFWLAVGSRILNSCSCRLGTPQLETVKTCSG